MTEKRSKKLKYKTLAENQGEGAPTLLAVSQFLEPLVRKDQKIREVTPCPPLIPVMILEPPDTPRLQPTTILTTIANPT